CHRFDRLEVEGRGEDAEPAEEHALGVVEQLVAPLDRREQRLLPREGGAGAAGQQPAAVVEPVGEPLERERPDARRRELERERKPVEAAADARHRGRAARVKTEPGTAGARPFDEQADGVEDTETLGITLALWWQGERRDPPRDLAWHAERLAAGREHTHAHTRSHQRIRDPGTAVQQVLAVVEHDQPAGPRERATPEI